MQGYNFFLRCVLTIYKLSNGLSDLYNCVFNYYKKNLNISKTKEIFNKKISRIIYKEQFLFSKSLIFYFR